MLRTARQMRDLKIYASDGEIGSIEEFYFDDETWTIRYMVVNTGNWLSRHLVLISPTFLHHPDWQHKRLHLSLTKAQIENSPVIDTQKPVSRQHEADYMDYFGASYYWGEPFMWGMGSYPVDSDPAGTPIAKRSVAAHHRSGDSHLRSTASVAGYHVGAINGEIGHVEDFLIDQDSWDVRYVEVTTRNWPLGKKVLISPQWITTVSWGESEVYVSLSTEVIKSAPEYIESRPLAREYENALHKHYRALPYWVQPAEHAVSAPTHGE